jgi:hypothetical protein
MRKPNAEYRSREHLTEQEVERLIEATATQKRIAATSQGVRLVLTPRRETTMKAAQMHTAARP